MNAGDKVRLKSGGPNMTIFWIEDGMAYCEWFLPTGKKEGDRFPLVALEQVP
ncbi:YodC family protein [Caulobacter sp. CCNWLW153]|uniref:YodC family protein n=1 Tax=unclassified Caulobacter TaxID=2648921 RepID=UPI003FA56761